MSKIIKDALLAILKEKARGKANALKEAELASMLYLRLSKNPQTQVLEIPRGGKFRACIDELRDDYQANQLQDDEYILSCNNGYFLPKTKEDFEGYLAEMTARKNKAAERIGIAHKCLGRMFDGNQIKMF